MRRWLEMPMKKLTPSAKPSPGQSLRRLPERAKRKAGPWRHTPIRGDPVFATRASPTAALSHGRWDGLRRPPAQLRSGIRRMARTRGLSGRGHSHHPLQANHCSSRLAWADHVPLGVPADSDQSDPGPRNCPGSTLRRSLHARLTTVIGRLRRGWPQAWVSHLRTFVMKRKARAQR
jgi:hypothetical protein